MTVDERLQNRLKHWKAQLIDTSKRNRLLYFKPSPTGTVQLIEPPLQDIYDRLIGRAQHLQFYPLEPEENLLDFDETDENGHLPPPLPPLRADEVRSNLSDKRLWKTLYALRQKARTSLQEQGVVTLFVAFGLVEWTESPSSNIRFQSPLLLAPVELLHESGISTYRLKLFEEDVTLNPTLVHKMNVDHGLALPQLPEGDTIHLETYFKQVAQCISSNRGWSVVPQAYLGLFSFHKIAMYKDLDAHAERAYSHPIIRALAGDASRLPTVPTDLPCDADLDRVVSPENTFQILDADSSQQEAIQAAKRGVSFVLQGPPGTGKSQTIANIIAERLDDGKKVLFVSEKMAALNVVYRRLSDHGLAEFCLQAHSHKANKKEVVQELGRTLNDARRATTKMEVDFSEFMRLKERLNAYVSALHVVRSPIQRTAYQIHGELARLNSAPDLQFSFDNVAQITPRDWSHINELLDELTRLQDVIASYSHHPWFGVHIHPYYSNEAKADIRAHFGALISSLNDLEERASSRATLCGVEKPMGLADVDRLIALFQLVSVTPKPPSAWFQPGAPTPLMEAARTYQARFTDYHGRRNTLLQAYHESVFDLPHDDLEARLTTRHQAILDRLRPEGEARGDTLIRQRAALQTVLDHTSQLLEQLGRDVPALATACALDVPNTFTSVGELCKTAALLACDPRPQADWFDRARLVVLRAEADEARSQYDAYLKVRDNIHARYEDTFLALDHSELLGHFTGAYSGFLRVFHPGYYRDLKALRSELKTPCKLGYEDAVRDLKAGRQYVDRKRWIDGHQSAHARDFGRHFNGLDTAWDGILDSLETCRNIVDRLGDDRVPEGMIRLLVDSGPSIAAIHRQRETAEAERNCLEQELNGLHRLISLESLLFTDKPLHEVELGALKTWVDAVAASVADFCAARDTAISCRNADTDTTTTEIAAVVSDLTEALIAFSNHHLYDDRLVTFPGPYVQTIEGPDRCVEFVFVPEGVYVRGKGKDAGTNRIEARRVAELVFRHFDTQPHRSLGVIAFSERQQTAIDDEVRRLRNLRPEFTHFFSEEGEEPFFIKNLENVQGDERDVILFSVGYGRDQTGKLSMNFGPLNKEGGERRLNVAVTRAKHQVKLVSSIQPQDMDLSRTQAKGPVLLKYYMEFAHQGPSALPRTITVTDDAEFGSPFEEEVCRALEARGLTVHRQIGCAGYRIDLAVVDEAHPGRYLLGIECDGAMYHSSKTARDRDRLRQQVLEDMGWQGRIIRIWSSDWIQNPEAQVLCVVEVLARARHAADESPPTLEIGPDTHEDTLETDDADDAAEPPFESIFCETGEPDSATLPEGVVPYRGYTSRKLGTPDDFYYWAEYKPGLITDILIEVVRQEGPIHITEATRRVVANWGMGKAGSVLMQHVTEAALRAVKRGAVKVHEDFLWPSDMVQAVVRVPTDNDAARPIEYVPLEEIAEACYLCVHSAFGIQRHELTTRIARLLGYNRTGAKVLQRIEEGIALCAKQQRVEIKDDFVRLVSS